MIRHYRWGSLLLEALFCRMLRITELAFVLIARRIIALP
jgi:hypothetical protein